MQNIRFCTAVIALFTSFFATAQNQAVIQTYIDTYKDMAIAEMQRTGVPASIKLAQGIHETMAGTSDLVTKSNNHFGIKCKTGWNGPSVSHDDDARGECFRKYESPADSYRDHSNFLKNSNRYASLFKLDPLDYSGWAYGLKKAGYATNPRYPQVIIKLIQDYNLQDYTLIAMGRGALKEDEVLASNNGAPENNIIPAVAVTTQEQAPRPAAQAKKSVKQYPSGEFKINDTRVVYVKEGVSFLSIAGQYNIALSRIFEFNDLQHAEVLNADQLIYLQRKRKTGNNEFHIVQEGETLYDVAQEEGIRLESLLEYNQLEKFMQPAAGEQLYLKSKAPGKPALVIGNASNTQPVFASNVESKQSITEEQLPTPKLTMHTVQAKETIYSISKKHNVKIEELVAWNQLTGNSLRTGQQLKIYKY